MPRFVILTHDHPILHWDFLLEFGDSCRTWRLSRSPDCEVPITAEAIADHRLDYLAYEGPVSGDRGTVSQWDVGTFEVHSETSTEIVIELRGRKLIGLIQLTASTDAQWQWLRNCHLSAF